MKMGVSRSLPLLLALALTLALFAGPAAAQDDQGSGIPKPTAEELQASREAASKALEVVAVLADPLLEKLGLGTAGARNAAALGEPIPVFNLNLNHLKGLGADESPTRLLTRSDEMFFPVSVGGTVVSSVTVEKHDDGWMMTSIGQSHLTAKLVELQRVMELAGEQVVAVNVPAMYQMFLVDASVKPPIFIPVYDVPVMELLAMQTIGSSELFDKLRSLVESFESALKEEEEDSPPPTPDSQP